MKLIVGLGNPGKEYENTRHNVGFEVIDHLVNGNIFSSKFNGLYYKDGDVIYLKPQTFMNLSGNCVVQFKNYFKIDGKDILIIHDDLDLPLGSAKIKFSSGSGGDNGVKSIIESLATNNFGQYKIGISNNKNIDTKDYVLGKFSKNERELLNKQILLSNDVIKYYINNDIEKTMSYYNGTLK